ncbi:MAG: ATP-binding cassette subfamily B protein [Planctomycetota bacterium]|jgi:ATP-binding cassette subfamily B protein
MKPFPIYLQHDAMDCGPTSLKMVAKYFGKNFTLQKLRELCHIDREGVSLLGISDAAESIGLKTLAVKASFDQMVEDAPLPFVAHWRQEHFVVVYKIKKRGKKYDIFIADPAAGKIKLTYEEFMKSWASDEAQGEKQGVALLFETTPDFYNTEDEKVNRLGFKFLFRYFFRYKKLLIQLALGFFIGSILQLIFPFLTQSIVDYGINNRDVNFIYLILAGQLMLFFSQTIVNFIRSWILLHIGTRINISLISDFLLKLMKLPISYFDTKMTGDIMQRINDHHRIEQFLTGSSLNILFSLFNLVIFGAVLCYYSVSIFVVFAIGSILYVLWILMFLKKRKELDYKQFNQSSLNQSKIVQLIAGMQEIKLNNSEKQKRWEWERIQAKLYKISIKSLALSQWQSGGAAFINKLSNIMITFLSAKLVIDGEVTIGMMLAIQYIIGQVNAPITQLISFVQAGQDAKLSLERLAEIHNLEDEVSQDSVSLQELPLNKDLAFENVSFQYGGPESEMVLKNINLTIPKGKITAIVGSSGSGKTTLLKLIMKFYEPKQGSLKIGNTLLNNLSNNVWRRNLGTVMQEGFIFSDTIAYNIGVGVEKIDKERLLQSVRIANLESFITSLPLGFNTKIGQEGIGVSQGQKQRILIARAVYKNPEYMLFDEATNSLDANNEMIIMKNLNEFYNNKTVVIVAHRLSTVKNADNIIVLENGELIEEGSHTELTNKRGAYYTLVKNQLELGS